MKKPSFCVGQGVHVNHNINGAAGVLPVDEPCVVREVLRIRGEGYRYALHLGWKDAIYWVDEEAINGQVDGLCQQ